MGEDRSQQLDNEAILSSLEIDTIGEILNISLGASATVRYTSESFALFKLITSPT